MSKVDVFNEQDRKEFNAIAKARFENNLTDGKVVNILSKLDDVIGVWDKFVSEQDDIYLGSLYIEVEMLKNMLVDFDSCRTVLERRLK